MSGHLPPIPPANRNKNDPAATHPHIADAPKPDERAKNLEDQAEEGNTFQNTHGHPQAR